MRLRLLPMVTVVRSQEDAVKVLTYLMKRGGPIAIDSETNGLDIMRCRVLCWSMATEDQRYFIPYEYLLVFDPLFQRRDVIWYLANAKFDLHMFANMGVQILGPCWDIIVADAMDDDTRRHGLKEQAYIHYDARWGDFKELFLDPDHVSKALGLEKNSFAQFKKMDVGEKLLFVWNEAPQIVENYASCDAYFTYMRAEDLKNQLAAQPLPTDMVEGFTTQLDYFTVIEVPFTKVLWGMERTGFPLDLSYAKKIDTPMREGIRAREMAIKKFAGPNYNPNSRDDLREILFSKQGFNLTPVGYTSKGKTPTASTGEKELTILRDRLKNNQKAYDFLTAQLEYGHLKKLHGSFVKNIEKHIFAGRVHPRYNQTGARTGRLSCTDPNLQQIPIRKDEFKIRGMFVSAPGEEMTDCDYPQIQPRLAAVLAPCPKMIDGIKAGWDIHSANAYNMYRKRDEKITFEAIEAAKKKKDDRKEALNDFEKMLLKLRDGAKTVGLGVMFGEGPTKMAHQLKLAGGRDEAMVLIQDFFDTYPEIKQLIDYAHDYAHEHESMYTMLGRLRRFHRINNPYNTGVAAAEERQAFNHLIQGSEVEVMKLAMLQLHHNQDFQDMGGKIAGVVHDELIAFGPKENIADILEIQKAIMADPLRWGPIQLTLPVPVDPDGAHGTRWSEVH